MSRSNVCEELQYACECVSARAGYGDPWAGVARGKLLSNGTKEAILNCVAEGPKTIAQIAKQLDLSQPSIHRHVTEMIASEMLRESREWERKYPSERYYEPNFPVVRANERAEFEAVCQEMARRVADLFEKRLGRLESAFDKTDLANRGWAFADITHYLYATVQRGAREALEQRGTLPPREKHNKGAEWIVGAEEVKPDDAV